ncbi:hypothetical protein CCACVL1_23798, partial [Corchorus capsularis]
SDKIISVQIMLNCLDDCGQEPHDYYYSKTSK